MKCPLSSEPLEYSYRREQGMEPYSRAAVERAIKVQEVILRAIAKQIT